MIVYAAFGLSVSTGYVLTMNYSIADGAMCTCQLDSAIPVACKLCILAIHWQIIIGTFYQVILDTCSLILHQENML